jgi:hypothetical protein
LRITAGLTLISIRRMWISSGACSGFPVANRQSCLHEGFYPPLPSPAKTYPLFVPIFAGRESLPCRVFAVGYEFASVFPV